MSYDDFDLEVSFSSYHEDMILLLVSRKTRNEILRVWTHGVAELRVRDHPKRLLVMTKPDNARGRGPDLHEMISIIVDPLRIVVNDEWQC